jgi:hypothetical protein
MSFLVEACLALASGQLLEEYTGPAYAAQDSKARPLSVTLKGTALVLCVRAQMSPAVIEKLFGPSAGGSRFRGGPIECWYPELGVTAYFPARAFPPPPGGYERVSGNLEP